MGDIPEIIGSFLRVVHLVVANQVVVIMIMCIQTMAVDK